MSLTFSPLQPTPSLSDRAPIWPPLPRLYREGSQVFYPLSRSPLQCSAGLSLASPPRLLLKRRARHQHGTSHNCFNPHLNSLKYLVLGSPKRQRVSAEAYKLDSPSPTVARKKRRGKSKPSSPEDSDARVKVHLPRRALSIPPTPVSYNEISQSTSPSSTENTGLGVQVARPGPTSPPSSVDATSAQGQPWPLVANNGKH